MIPQVLTSILVLLIVVDIYLVPSILSPPLWLQ